jgi:hypothetical protein
MGRFGILLSDNDYYEDDDNDSCGPLVGASSSLFLPPSSISSEAVARFRSESKNDRSGGESGTAAAAAAAAGASNNGDLEYSDDDDESEEDGEPSTSSSNDAYGEDSLGSDEEDDDDDDEEEEPPHPLGFVRGPSSRYAVDWLVVPSKEAAVLDYKRRMGYKHAFSLKDPLLGDDNPNIVSSPPMQQFPPLASYLDPKTASTLDLVEVARAVSIPTAPQVGDDDAFDYKVAAAAIRDHEIQEIVDLFATTLGDESSDAGNVRALGPPPTTIVRDPLGQLSVDEQMEPYRAMQMDQRRVEAEVEGVRGTYLKENQERRDRLTELIREQQDAAQRLQDEIDRRRLDAERAEMQKQVEEQERLEGEQRRADAAQRKKEEDDEDEERKRLQQQQQQQQQEAAEQERVQAARAAAEPEFVARAHRLVSQLVQVRASVEPFETSTAPTVKRRRLQMKKLVAGKVNTLTENADKIRSVAAEVSQAIAAARAEDEQVRQQNSAGAHGVSSEMARGKRYLIDLLSSKVIVRVQAEGFNGYENDWV